MSGGRKVTYREGLSQPSLAQARAVIPAQSAASSSLNPFFSVWEVKMELVG